MAIDVFTFFCAARAGASTRKGRGGSIASCTGIWLFSLTNETSSGEKTAGNALRYVNVNKGELDALVVRGYLTEEERGNSAAIKKAIEAVLWDLEFELQSETADRGSARV